MQWPWPRWVEVMTSSSRRGQHAADRGRLLPDGEVHEAGHEAVAVERCDALLEATNERHAAVHLHQLGVRRQGRTIAADRHGRVVY